MTNNELTKRFGQMKEREMLYNQMWSYRLTLQKSGLDDKTVLRKMRDIGHFICHLEDLRENGITVKFDNINNIAFNYVKDGYFTTEDKEGCEDYRRLIFSNIRQGFNYVYEDMSENLIKKLTTEQKEILKEISKNNWFRCSGVREEKNVNDSIQTQLMEQLGLKVYFDEDGKPYVLSHETAELLGIKNKNMMATIRTILERYSKFTRAKNSAHATILDISMVEDFYEVETPTGGKDKRLTFRLSKDLIIHYVLGLTGEKYFEFKVNYQSAFNFIEEEHKILLEKHSELKERFLKMYNEMRKQNRDLLVNKKK